MEIIDYECNVSSCFVTVLLHYVDIQIWFVIAYKKTIQNNNKDK